MSWGRGLPLTSPEQPSCITQPFFFVFSAFAKDLSKSSSGDGDLRLSTVAVLFCYILPLYIFL